MSKPQVKYVWSNRFGKDKREGLHKWLEKNVSGYDRAHLMRWVDGFAKSRDKESHKHKIGYASQNFGLFIKYVKSINP